MNLIESWYYRRPMFVTYYNSVIVTENHLRFVTGRHIRANVEKTFTSFVYMFNKLHDMRIPTSRQ